MTEKVQAHTTRVTSTTINAVSAFIGCSEVTKGASELAVSRSCPRG